MAAILLPRCNTPWGSGMHQHKINPLRDLAPPASGASGLTVLRGHQPEAWPWLVCLSHRSCVSSAITPAGNPGDHRRGAQGIGQAGGISTTTQPPSCAPAVGPGSAYTHPWTRPRSANLRHLAAAVSRRSRDQEPGPLGCDAHHRPGRQPGRPSPRRHRAPTRPRAPQPPSNHRAARRL